MLDKLRNISFLRAIPFFLFGIVAYVFAHSNFMNYALVLIFVFLYFAYSVYQLLIQKEYRLRWINGLFIAFNLFCLGYAITFLHSEINHPNHYTKHYTEDKYVLLQVKIDEAPVQKKRSQKFIANIISMDKKLLEGKILCYAEDSLANTLSFGDILFLKVKPSALSAPLNPAQFDFAHFMRFRQVHHQIYFTAKQVVSIEHNTPIYSLFYWSYQFRDKLSALLEQHIQDEQAFEVAASLLLGFREKLDKETIQAYSASGAMHVLAVSGLHVGIFYWILNHLFFFLNGSRRLRYFKTLVLILIIWAYAFVTGLSPSIQRAALMFSLVGIAQNINRSSGIYNSIVVSAFILLCYNPYLLMEVGFQLSYTALLGIIAFHPIFYRQIFIEHKVLDWFWSITCVSLAAQLATFPIGLLYFHQFPIYFMLSNLLVIPAASLLLPMGLLFFAIAALEQFFALNFISSLLGGSLDLLFQLLNYLVFQIEELPGSLLIGFSPSIAETWFSYTLIISLLLLYYYRKKTLIYISMASIFCLLIFYNFSSWQNAKHNALTFYAIKGSTAIDINHYSGNYFLADSTLLENKDQMLFSVIHNWWQKGYTKKDSILKFNIDKEFQSERVYYKMPFLQVNEHLVLILDAKNEIKPLAKYLRHLATDIILLRNNPYFILDNLDEIPETTPILLDGTNSYAFKRSFKNALEGKSLVSHTLMESGAYVYSL